LHYAKLFARFLESGQQAVRMLARAEGDAHASVTPLIARTVADKNAPPPHLFNK
jgi:hypothetical protein